MYVNECSETISTDHIQAPGYHGNWLGEVILYYVPFIIITIIRFCTVTIIVAISYFQTSYNNITIGFFKCANRTIVVKNTADT